MKIRVHIKPGVRSKSESVTPGSIWEIIVREPATDGRANMRAVELIAAHFGIAKSNVALVNGAASRYKTFEISGVDKSSQ